MMHSLQLSLILSDFLTLPNLISLSLSLSNTAWPFPLPLSLCLCLSLSRQPADDSLDFCKL